jgi:hypothetical protein
MDGMRTFQYNQVMKNEPLVPRGLVMASSSAGKEWIDGLGDDVRTGSGEDIISL